MSSSVPPILKTAWSLRSWLIPIFQILGIVLGLGALWKGPTWVATRASDEDISDVYLGLQDLAQRVGAPTRPPSARYAKGYPGVTQGDFERRLDLLEQKQAQWSTEQSAREAAMLRRIIVMVAAMREPTRARKQDAAIRARKDYDELRKDGVSPEVAFERALGLDAE